MPSGRQTQTTGTRGRKTNFLPLSGTDLKNLSDRRCRLDVSTPALGGGNAHVSFHPIQNQNPRGVHGCRTIIDRKTYRERVDRMIDSGRYRRSIQFEGGVIPDLLGNRLKGDVLFVLDPRRNDVKYPADRRCRVITVISHLHGRYGRGPCAQNRDVVSNHHGNRGVGGNVTDGQPGRSNGEKREGCITHCLVHQGRKTDRLGTAESRRSIMVRMKKTEEVLQSPFVSKVTFDFLAIDRIDRLIEDQDFCNFPHESLSQLIERYGSLRIGIGTDDFPIDPQGLTVGHNPQRVDRPSIARRLGNNPYVLRRMTQLEKAIGSRGGQVSSKDVGCPR